MPLLEVVSMHLSDIIKHPDTLGQAVRPCGADRTAGRPTAPPRYVSLCPRRCRNTVQGGGTGLGDSKNLAEMVQQLVCGDVTLDLDVLEGSQMRGGVDNRGTAAGGSRNEQQ
jgi:hypothetical protein